MSVTTYVVQLSQFTLQTTVSKYILDNTKDGAEITSFEVLEPIPQSCLIEFLQAKMKTDKIDKITLLGPASYAIGIKNQLSSSIEFSTKPIEIEIKERF